MTDLTNTLEISYEDALAQVTAPGGDFAVVEEEINGVRYPEQRSKPSIKEKE